MVQSSVYTWTVKTPARPYRRDWDWTASGGIWARSTTSVATVPTSTMRAVLMSSDFPTRRAMRVGLGLSTTTRVRRPRSIPLDRRKDRELRREYQGLFSARLRGPILQRRR